MKVVPTLFFSEAMNATGLTVVEGEFEVNTQYHFYMETQSILARPSEKGQLGTYLESWALKVVPKLIVVPFRYVCSLTMAG